MGMREGQPDKIPLLDKAALGMVGGLLLPFSMPMDNPVSTCTNPTVMHEAKLLPAMQPAAYRPCRH